MSGLTIDQQLAMSAGATMWTTVGYAEAGIPSLAMADGRGSLDLPQGVSYALDPHSKLLRELPHIGEFQQDMEARRKAAEQAKRPE